MSRFFKIPYRSSLLVALMGATLVVAGCKTMEGDTAAADAQNATQVTQRAEQASQVALATKAEVPGTYEGLLPCADCEGIQTTYHINNMVRSFQTKFTRAPRISSRRLVPGNTRMAFFS